MKILYLRTSSFQCDPHVGSILQLAEERQDLQVVVRNYFVDSVDGMITEWAAHERPDVVIWLGVAAGPYKPSAMTFALLRMAKIKTIMLCPEASHPDWDVLIQDFLAQESFDLIVNLDGNSEWNTGGRGHTTLAIYDQRPYRKPQVPWHERGTDVGFCGGVGFAGTMRQRLIDHMKGPRKSKFTFTELPFIDTCGTYQEYADFLMSCRVIINPAGSSGERTKHVKGRVIEAGLANCLLVEEEGSPISKWFSSSHYASFIDPLQCDRLIEAILYSNIGTYRVSRFNQEVRTKYSPEVLWGEIFRKVGL